MNPAWFAAALGILNVVAVLMLTIDRWVNSVTGKASHETRLTDLEKKFDTASQRFSEKWGEIQVKLGDIQITQGQQEEHFRSTDQRVTDLRTDLNVFRDR